MNYAVMPMNDWKNIIASVKAKTGKTEGFLSGQVASEIDSISVGSDENTLNEYLKGTKTVIAADDLAGVTSIRDYTFRGSPITSVDIPDSVTSIGERAFYNCSSLTSITIPDSVTGIGGEAFRACSSLTSIVIPDSVRGQLPARMCLNCINLTALVIGNNVTYTGESGFSGCFRLQSVTLGNSVSFISQDSFNTCISLAKITLPNSVGVLSNRAFAGCTNLMKIICLAETPPELRVSSFDNVPADCVIKVPAASVDAYKSAPNWIARADYITAIEEGE